MPTPMSPTHRVLLLNDEGRPITQRVSYGEPQLEAAGAVIRTIDEQGRTVLLLPGQFNAVVVDPYSERRDDPRSADRGATHRR